jgi:putative two-component system response regulator
MSTASVRKQRILIADDSEMNRAILIEMLENEYDILDAENGLQAVALLQQSEAEVDLLLLDIVMPEMDGFAVLEIMNQRHWIDTTPVIMISAERTPSHVERAYALGVTDFISRPFDALIVHKRIVNTILLYTKQKALTHMVAEQIYENEKRSNLMIDILSHIVEFRNGESGRHVLNIRALTELLLRCLVKKTSAYKLSSSDISTISLASALHDVGKISIPSEILNKPGKLTDEEYAIMKTHSAIGAQIMTDLPIPDEPLLKYAREICRWHHERYDGCGYPDGLSGDDIPISAQIVSLADVYDALTSERVYKPPYSHGDAIRMILDGQCGIFNPLLLECLTDLSDTLPDQLQRYTDNKDQRQRILTLAEEVLGRKNLTSAERAVQLLERERTKTEFFADMSQEMQFEYTLSPSMLTFNSWGAHRLELPETILDPHHSPVLQEVLSAKDFMAFANLLRNTTPTHPVVNYTCQFKIHGNERWCELVARSLWSSDDPPRYTGVVGKAVDIHESRLRINTLEQQATHDATTGLLNHTYAAQRIRKIMKQHPDGHFVMAIFDLDHFKNANDTYGHLFGNRVLSYVAAKLRRVTRSSDIVARVGGDEFLIFMEYTQDPTSTIAQIFTSLRGSCEGFPISVSMGISRSELVGTDYAALFHAADKALYVAKRAGRDTYRFFDDSMQDTLPSTPAIANAASAVEFIRKET